MTHTPQEPVAPVWSIPSADLPDHSRVFERFPRPQPASTALRIAAGLSFALFVGVDMVRWIGSNAGLPYMIGRLIGALLLPLLAVGIASLWDANRTQKTRVKVFMIASLVCAALFTYSLFTHRDYAHLLPGAKPRTASDIEAVAMGCLRQRDLACAQDQWTSYLAMRPTDSRAMAWLGIVMNMRDDHALAVAQFKKAVEAGEGSYDLFAYHADSLAKLGRTDEAIDWSYRALRVEPKLVDVRGSLAKLLVSRQRPHEALALLLAYDTNAEAEGHPARFTGQRVAIETAMQDANDAVGFRSTKNPLRLPSYNGHFFAPVVLGKSGGTALAFMVDTGASRTTLSEKLLNASKAQYTVTNDAVTMTTADGRRVSGKAVTIASMRLGPHVLTHVQAVLCADCLPLLGQSTLSRFDLQSSRVQGVEFLSLSPRGAS